VRRWLITLALLLILSPSAAVAEPLDAALQQQLLVILDKYNHGLAAGNWPDAFKQRSARMRALAEATMPKTPAERKRFTEDAKMMVPDKVEVTEAALDAAGSKATIITLQTKKIPKGEKIQGGTAPGSTVSNVVVLTFVKEADGWKLDDLVFNAEPPVVVACKDETYEPESAYDTDRTVSIGGPIARVDFQSQYTLVVVRVVDEEECAFIRANKAELLAHGLDPDKLLPETIVEIEASPHKTDKQKLLVDSLNIQPGN
jgi:hypothetical protein